MKIRMNPIVKKDMQVTARSMKLSWGLFVYEFVLVCAFLLALLIIESESDSIYGDNVYSYLVYLFPVIACVQMGIVALVMPIITASSISGEKERQTFDIMMTTCMSPFSIVFGKVISAVIKILFFVFASMPIMALSFVAGGISWLQLASFFLMLLLLAFFSGSIGIFCSSVCNRAITAVISSFIIYFVIYGVSFVPVLLQAIFGSGSVGESLLILLFNPVVLIEEFFMKIMTGETVMTDMHITKKDAGLITYYLIKDQLWIYASIICVALMSFGFMLLATWRVNPLHSSERRRKKKKGEE